MTLETVSGLTSGPLPFAAKLAHRLVARLATSQLPSTQGAMAIILATFGMEVLVERHPLLLRILCVAVGPADTCQL